MFTVVTVIVGLFATPPLLRWLGDERFGAFRVTTDWYGYLSLFELGLSGALLPMLAKAVGRQDLELVRRTLAAGVRAYLRVGLVMLAGGLVLAAAITWLVPVSATNAADLRRGSIIVLLGIAFVPLAPFRALIEARQRGYWINLSLLLHSLLVTGLALIMAWAGWGISGQSLAGLLAGITLRVILSWEALRHFPGLLAASIKQAPDANVWRGLWNLNRPTLIFNLASRVGLLTDNIIVAGFLGAAPVVPFLITQRLATLAQREMQGIGNASWAALAELHARGELESFNQRLIELTTLVTALGVGFLVPLAAYNRHFVALWVGPAQYGGEALTIIASLNAILLAVFSFWGWCVTGTGRIGEMTNAMVVQSIINLVLSIILTKRLGFIGCVLGTLISFLAVSVWYLPRLLHRLFSVSLRELFGAVAAPLALGMPYAAIVWWFADISEPSSLLATAFEIGLAALLYLALWWLLVLKRAERDRWSARIRMLPRGVVAN